MELPLDKVLANRAHWKRMKLLLSQGRQFPLDEDTATWMLGLSDLAERALQKPKLTPHAVDTIRNLAFECYLPLEGFIERLKDFGVEVVPDPPRNPQTTPEGSLGTPEVEK